MKSWSLKFLGLSGHIEVCVGTVFFYRYRINVDVLIEIVVSATIFTEIRADSFETSSLIYQITESHPSIT